ncbi:MAG: TonB-dependent receptor [Ekhidna sp.]|nr:TonB-dependent receptor [Ekhidna sp.]
MKTFFLSVLLLISSTVLAQDSLKTVQLEEVAITAVRASAQAPVPQANISKKQIEEVYVGQHPIFMLERMTPGFYSFSESGTSFANYGSFRLRGINQERINITLTGVPLNDMIDQGVFFSNFTDIANNFESIQVQRGVGTSSNGVSSYGGSINFESINLRNKEAFSAAQLGAGSFNTLRANFQNFTGINKKGWGFLTSISKLTSDGYRDNTETDATSIFLTGGYYGDDEIFKLTFFTSRAENGLGYSTVEKSILENDPTFNPLSENDEDDFQQFLLQMQYNKILSPKTTLGVTGYYGGAGGDFVTFGQNFPLRNDHVGSILNLDFTDGNLSVNSGIHAYTFRRKNEESALTDLDNPTYSEESSKNEISWFAKAAYELGNLTAYADLQIRNTRLNISPDYSAVGISPEGDISFDWTFINPRIGLTYDVNNALSLYSSYGRSGREPTKIDLFGGFRLDTINYISVRNSSFSEEYVNDFELGVRLTKQNFVIDGNFYYMDFDNEIAPIGRVLTFGVQERDNIKNSTRAGFELMWAYMPTSETEFTGNIAYLSTNIEQALLDTVEIQNKEQILSPDLIVNAQVKYKPSQSISLSLSGRYLGEQFMEITNDPLFTVPSSFVTDFMIEANISEAITLSGSINNLLDETYYTFGTPNFTGTEPAFFAQPERNFFLSLNVKF